MDPEKVKLIALYFPQFHRIAENDAWWGDGFTDWTNVKRAVPQFEGHYQPRIPLAGNYYDQSDLATVRRQVELAKAYGLYGFCHYHYWFEGKQLLETPTNLMLANRDIDFPFCLAWANETWTRRWVSEEGEVLQAQRHTPDIALWEQHFQYLIRAWSDPRAICIDGKPIFMIYRPRNIEQIGKLFAYWNARAIECGLKGVFFVAMRQHGEPDKKMLKHFQGSMHFQPFEAMDSPDYQPYQVPVEEAANSQQRGQFDGGSPRAQQPGYFRLLWRRLPFSVRYLFGRLRWRATVLTRSLARSLMNGGARFSKLVREHIRRRDADPRKSIVIWDYDSAWNQIIKVENDFGLTTFPGAFVDWDNTARYGQRARLFKGASPERFEYWFNRLVENTATRPVNERFIFMNAWNEWAEGTYLEPDERYGYRHLEIVRDALAKQSKAVDSSHPMRKPRD